MIQEYESFNAESYPETAEAQPVEVKKVSHREIFRDEEFGTHFRVFMIIVGSLFALDVLTGGGFWFQYVALSWGIGLSCHYWDTYINYNFKNTEKKDLYMHGAVTATLIVFFFFMDLATSWRLSWWLYPSIPLLVAWLIHRATVFNTLKPKGIQKPPMEAQVHTEYAVVPTEEQEAVKFCANCGAGLEAGFKFCKYCGKPAREE